MVGRAVLHARGGQQKLQLTAHLRLPDEFRQRARAQGALESQLGFGLEFGRGEVVVGHRTPVWAAGPSRARVSLRRV